MRHSLQAASLASALVLLATPALSEQTAPKTSVTSTTGADWSQSGPVATPPAPPPPQREEEDRVLLGPKIRHGGYGAPELKVTSMTGDGALLVGGQGGWIINHSFVIGAAGYGLATVHDAPAALSPANARSTLQFGYGGPRFAYILRPHDPVHFTFGALVGGGGYTIATHVFSTDTHYTHDGNAFFVLEPQVELEANVIRWMRVGLGVSYRYVGATNTPGLGPSDLSGVVGSFFIKGGVF